MLRIISQDNKRSFPMELLCLEQDGCLIFGYVHGKEKVLLGAYKNNKRAEAVFYEIHKEWKLGKELSSDAQIYRMPKD